uniref:Glycosyltransferase family 92 protein n=1 Tax=Caenorhabditis japonica TaxID=281687 RepID=A0A8R1EGJ0_CAEJA
MLVHDVGEYEKEYKPLILDPTVGYIRHYRDVHLSNWMSRNKDILEQWKPFENTTYNEPLKSKLLINVLQVLNEVYGT